MQSQHKEVDRRAKGEEEWGHAAAAYTRIREEGQGRRGVGQQGGVKACLYVHPAVFHIFLLAALGACEEAQHLVPLAFPPFLLASALLRHADVQPQVCCLSRSQVAQIEVSPAGLSAPAHH